jgi:LacI family transcriptional regulator
MNERRVTLADIAVKAGVHVTTVSLALRNNPRLPESTRERIQALAKQMGYRPDPFLRALVSYRGKIMERRNMPTLAYVTNWNTRWGWKKVTAHGEFFAGALAKANEFGYRLEHFWLHELGLTQDRLSRMLYARGINGLIIASHSREMGDELQLDWKNFSAVKIDYFPHHPKLHNVTNNQCSIVRLAMQKVTAAGYRRVGFVMHRGWDHAVDHNWTAGYLCEQQHLPLKDRIAANIFPELHPVERWFHEHNALVQVDFKPFEKWLNRCQPEVLISKSAYVLPVLQKMGLKIPRDIAFVDLFLDQTDGLVAGVRQNHETVGAVAVEILAGQLQHNKFGVPEIPTTTFVEGTWYDGQSCPALQQTGKGGKKSGPIPVFTA